MVKQQLLERIKHLPIKKQKKIINQAIDIAVKMYQESQLQEDFDLIVDLYQPFKYIRYWQNKYIYLCDNNPDDFKSEYMLCFVKACNFYKKENNYKKICYFNKYFFSIVNNYFINKMSKLSCSKRSLLSKCPLCDEQVTPLNLHILKEHPEFIQNFIDHYDIKNKCTLCSETYIDSIEKHIINKHSRLVYEYFQRLYPNSNTFIQDPAQPIGLIYINDEKTDILENVEVEPLYYNKNQHFDDLNILNDLSECQKTITKIFHYYNISKLPSYKKLCEMCFEMRRCSICPRGEKFKLTKQIYANEISGLGEKIK